MTEELKQKAIKKASELNLQNVSLSGIVRNRIADILVEFTIEATNELQEELEEWKAEWQEQVQKAIDEGYARTQLQIENGKLKEQIEKMKRHANCKNCHSDGYC